VESGSGEYVGEQKPGSFSPYTSLGVAKGDSELGSDGWMMDSPVVGA